MKKALAPALLTMALLAALLWAGPAPVHGQGFEVNNEFDDADAHDATPGDCICADTYGQCTLRAAIETANDCPGADTITFKFPMNIDIRTSVGALPALIETTRVDASAVWHTAAGKPGVVINGAGGAFSGLILAADSCEVYGLYIAAFGLHGIHVISANNTIGDSGADQRNVLSANGTGLALVGTPAHSNVVRNNFIGLESSGDKKHPNTTGLLISAGAKNNTIGGPETAHANWISGNTNNGIIIENIGTDGNWVGGNAIGPSYDLTADLGNGADGVLIQMGASNTVIGDSQAGNFIAYNAYTGIYVDNGDYAVRIGNNIIGGNKTDGISINQTPSNEIGGNIIKDNALAGVRVNGANAAANWILIKEITGNGDKGILLTGGANKGIGPPAITRATGRLVQGTGACPGCTVTVHSDPDDEGQVWQGKTTADSAGNWSHATALFGPNVTASVYDAGGNTSEFSVPFDISAIKYEVFVPQVRR